ISGSYSTVCTHDAAATSPSRWDAIRSWRARCVSGSSGSSLTSSIAAHEPACDEVAVETAESSGGHAPRVPLRSRRRAEAHRAREHLVGEQPLEWRREVDGVAPLDEETGPLMLHQ